jgi:hypothetical protein
MDNLLYIVIGIAWVAYSLYSARQKAIAKQQSSGLPPKGPSQSSPLPIPGGQSGGKSLLEDIFRELTAEPKQVPQANKPVSTSYPAQSKNPLTTETPKSFQGFKTVPDSQSDFPLNDIENEPKKHTIHEKMTNIESSSKKFDLREAVIFSELLNRKYF